MSSRPSTSRRDERGLELHVVVHEHEDVARGHRHAGGVAAGEAAVLGAARRRGRRESGSASRSRLSSVEPLSTQINSSRSSRVVAREQRPKQSSRWSRPFQLTTMTETRGRVDRQTRAASAGAWRRLRHATRSRASPRASRRRSQVREFRARTRAARRGARPCPISSRRPQGVRRRAAEAGAQARGQRRASPVATERDASRRRARWLAQASAEQRHERRYRARGPSSSAGACDEREAKTVAPGQERRKRRCVRDTRRRAADGRAGRARLTSALDGVPGARRCRRPRRWTRASRRARLRRAGRSRWTAQTAGSRVEADRQPLGRRREQRGACGRWQPHRRLMRSRARRVPIPAARRARRCPVPHDRAKRVIVRSGVDVGDDHVWRQRPAEALHDAGGRAAWRGDLVTGQHDLDFALQGAAQALPPRGASIPGRPARAMEDGRQAWCGHGPTGSRVAAGTRCHVPPSVTLPKRSSVPPSVTVKVATRSR